MKTKFDGRGGRKLDAKSTAALQIELLEDRVLLASDFYPIDGTGNNLVNPEWGSTDIHLVRLTTTDYADGLSSPSGQDRPSARAISNTVVAQTESITNNRFLTDMVWLWGQFIDHDIDLTQNAEPAEPFDIGVPSGDPFFDPFATGNATIGLNRSIYETDEHGVRQQINQITAFLDGSVIYGSDAIRANALRLHEGGRLATSEGDLLPFNTFGLPNAGGNGSNLFLAGDVRANENAALTAMHTLWLREHNYWAGQIAADEYDGHDLSDPTLDEEIYQRARAIVIAELQSITYNEFLPALLGSDAIAPYQGYNAAVNPGIANIFSTASYRLGHSMLSSELLRLNNDGSVIDAGNLPLANAFFAPHEIMKNGVASLLLGATSQMAQEIDTQIVDAVRNFLFGPPGAGGFDLSSLNIQRGRDHGLPSYNQARIDFGLAPAATFADISSDPLVQTKLQAVYDSADDVDIWVGALAEDHMPGASVGELNYIVLVDQFTRIRNGDRFWYENIYTGDALAQIQNTTLSEILERNICITGLRDNVFYDASVMYYKSDFNEPADMTITMKDGNIRFIDNQTGQVLESHSTDQIAQVHLVGQSGMDDRFVIANHHRALIPGEFVIFGGFLDTDTLIVLGTNKSDRIAIHSQSVHLNEMVVGFTTIDHLVIHAGPGNDVIEVEANDFAITIFGGPGLDTLLDPNEVAEFIGGPGRDKVNGQIQFASGQGHTHKPAKTPAH